MTSMAVRVNIYIVNYKYQFSKIQFTILIMFLILVSVLKLSYFPYIFIQEQAF